MAYQNPSYCFLHAAADAGAASMFASDNETGTPDREDPDYPLENLIDYRPSSLFKFSAGDTNNAVYIDRGAGTLENITWIIIPPGHNLATAGVCLLESDTTSAWAAPNNRASWTQTGESDPDGIITKVTETFNDRYVRFRVNAPSTAWRSVKYGSPTSAPLAPQHSTQGGPSSRSAPTSTSRFLLALPRSHSQVTDGSTRSPTTTLTGPTWQSSTT